MYVLMYHGKKCPVLVEKKMINEMGTVHILIVGNYVHVGMPFQLHVQVNKIIIPTRVSSFKMMLL